MPRLSIVIPCLAGVESLETTLASVLQNRPEDCEILVAHDGIYGDPYDLRGEVRFVETDQDAFAAELIAAGCDAARGTVLHLLQPGAEVEEGWTDQALAHFDDPSVAAVAPLVLDSAERDRVVSAGISYGPGGGRWIRRRGAAAGERCRVLGPTIGAAFYRRSTFKSAGGIDPSVGIAMADVDLALSLKARGYRAILEPACRVYGPALSVAGDSAYVQGQGAERVFWRHASEIGWLSSLLLHPMLVAGEFALGLGRGGAVSKLLGRAAACLDSSEAIGGEEQTPTPPPTPARSGKAILRIDSSHNDAKSRAQKPAEQRERAA